jgi:hypothetical protein
MYSKGHIPPYKIAKFMSEHASIDHTSSSKVMLDTKYIDFPSDTKFWIVLKNGVTGNEQISTKALDKKQTKRWSESFANSNLFSNVNLYGKYSFPKLRLPDKDTDLWEQTGFKIDNIDFVATTIMNPSKSLDSSSDHVHIVLKTPWLPKTYSAYKTLASSNSRKLILYYEAIKTLLLNENFKSIEEPFNISDPTIPYTPAQMTRLAKKQGGTALDAEILSQAKETLLNFSIAATLHGEAMVNNAEWHTYKLEGIFVSNEIERNAGSVTIPSLLSVLYPLLFILDDTNDICYDIIQPCKYAYSFVVRNIGGCKIWGAVNMAACEESLINSYDQYKVDDESSSSNIFRHSGKFGMYLDILSIHQLKQLITVIQDLMNKLSSNFKSPDLKPPFDAIEYPLENDNNDEIYTGEMFKMKLRYMGLELIQQQLNGFIEYKEKIENTRIVDHFIQQLIHAHNGEPYVNVNNNKTLAIVVNAFIQFIHTIIGDFVSNVKTSEGSVKPSAILNYLDNKVPSKTFTFEQSLMFIKSCMGIAPPLWKSNVMKELNMSTDQLLKAIYYMPSLFKMLFSANLFQEQNPNVFMETHIVPLLAQNNITFEGSIYESQLKRDGYSKSQSESNIKAALVYKVFETKSVSDWQWKD